MLKVAREPLTAAWPEISDYAEDHMRTVGMPGGATAVSPQLWFQMELEGRLRFYGLRNSWGFLVGYLWVALYPQPLAGNEMRSTTLAFYVQPELRGAGAGRMLIEAWEGDMLERGIHHLSIGSPVANSIEAQAGALGYNPHEVILTKVLA